MLIASTSSAQSRRFAMYFYLFNISDFFGAINLYPILIHASLRACTPRLGRSSRGPRRRDGQSWRDIKDRGGGKRKQRKGYIEESNPYPSSICARSRATISISSRVGARRINKSLFKDV